LESEETGFSAVEEEVKTSDFMPRPTVYAGMLNKLEHSENKSVNKLDGE
jgi:hypothetical protein